MESTIGVYEADRSHGGERTLDPSAISWTATLQSSLRRGLGTSFSLDAVTTGLYRPFTKVVRYVDSVWTHRTGQTLRSFPTRNHPNRGFTLTGAASHYDFCLISTEAAPDLHLLDTGHFFARWRYDSVVPTDGLLELEAGVGEVVDGYRKIDNITDQALTHFQTAYGESFAKDDIFYYVYGVLHSPDYRETYAADLKKSLPRIPLVGDATPFVEAGRKLSELHLGYETVEPYPLDGLETELGSADPYQFYRVAKMKFAKVRDPESKKLVAEKSTVIYNTQITLSGIPEAAHRYMLGSRSAIEWIIDRYRVKTDKQSGIVNDPNDWSLEVEDPRYIIDLLARIVTVSLETMAIVDSLPALDIRDTQG